MPAAVSVFDQEDLDDRGLRTVGDLQFHVPSLVADGFSPLIVRGVGQPAGIAATPGVALYQNGVLASRGAALTTLHDVERIEILRGPQDALYGRAAVGGVAVVVPRAPRDAFEAAADYQLASGWESRLRGVLNAPVVGDRAAVRLAVLYADEPDDFGRRSARRPDAAVSLDQALLTVRSALRYQLRDDLRADLVWTFLDRDGGRNDGATPADRFASPAEQAHFATLQLAWLLGDFTVASTTGYQSAEASFVMRASPARDDTRTWSQELSLGFDDGGPFLVLMALRYLDEEDEWREGRQAGRPAARTDGVATVAARAVWSSVAARHRSRVVEGFTDATYKVTPRWRLRAGFRLARTDQKLADSASLGEVGRRDRSAPSNGPRRADWTAVTWRVGGDFDLGDYVLLYGGVSTADRPGGFDFWRADPYRDENLLACEVGAKGQAFDDRLRADLVAFYYDYDDVQVREAAGFGATVNLPAAAVYGVEIGGMAAPFGGLRVDGAGGWLEADVDGDARRRPAAATIGVDGHTLPNAPRFSAHVGAQYAIAVDEVAWLPDAVRQATRGELTARFDYVFRDAMYFDAANRMRQDAWDRGDLRLIYQPAMPAWDLRVEAFARNVWDERPVLGVIPSRAVADALVVHGERRAFGLRVSTRFR